MSLTLLLFLVLAMRIFPPSVLIVDDKLSRLLLASISGFLLLAAAKVSIYFYLYGWPRYSDPYSEPSHLALYLLPLIIYRLTGRLTDVWSWLAVALAMLFAPSTTLVIGLVLLLIVIVIQGGLSFKKAITIFFSVSLAYVLSQFDLFDTSHYTDRIRGVMQSGSPIYINTSSLIWLNGWSQAQESLVGTFGLGTGFNQMGCGRFAFSGIFSWQMLVGNGLLLNTENGSFTAAKIIAELGIAGVIIVFFLTILSVRSILKVRTVKIYDVSDTQGDLRNIVSRARATAGVCILIFLYIRNPGYFQLPLITALSLLFIRATDVIKMGHRSQSFNQMKEC
ncbi:hypothetical protein [Thiorhodovibrio litoralis]|uniref:hypothetical protein n=1 Tax=Thiorhodovibrio litoralis TaxID=2952932 RepID=UPI002B261DA1|nr:hypothetical protein [Thiorhodovibrio litoralis]WPL11527.1 hypothetical protein Thiosp_01274 [Thiorhodovibrio litoralis]